MDTQNARDFMSDACTGISCEDVEFHLSDHIDGVLHAVLTRRINKHLGGCEVCRESRASLAGMVYMARTLAGEDQPMPKGARKRLREALNERLDIELEVPEE